MQNEPQKIVRILDDLFYPPTTSYGKRWDSLSLEEKVGAIAEKLDEVIERVNGDTHD